MAAVSSNSVVSCSYHFTIAQDTNVNKSADIMLHHIVTNRNLHEFRSREFRPCDWNIENFRCWEDDPSFEEEHRRGKIWVQSRFRRSYVWSFFTVKDPRFDGWGGATGPCTTALYANCLPLYLYAGDMEIWWPSDDQSAWISEFLVRWWCHQFDPIKYVAEHVYCRKSDTEILVMTYD